MSHVYKLRHQSHFPFFITPIFISGTSLFFCRLLISLLLWVICSFIFSSFPIRSFSWLDRTSFPACWFPSLVHAVLSVSSRLYFEHLGCFRMCLLIEILTWYLSGEKNDAIRIDVIRIFVWGFLFIWLMVKLYLQFALSQRLKFYVVYGFYFSYCLYFPRKSLLEQCTKAIVLFIVMQDPYWYVCREWGIMA